MTWLYSVTDNVRRTNYFSKKRRLTSRHWMVQSMFFHESWTQKMAREYAKSLAASCTGSLISLIIDVDVGYSRKLRWTPVIIFDVSSSFELLINFCSQLAHNFDTFVLNRFMYTHLFCWWRPLVVFTLPTSDFLHGRISASWQPFFSTAWIPMYSTCTARVQAK